MTAVGLAGLGHDVHLVETGAARLAALRDGRVPIHEAGLQEAFTAAVAAGCLTVADAAPRRPRDRPRLRRHADRRRRIERPQPARLGARGAARPARCRTTSSSSAARCRSAARDARSRAPACPARGLHQPGVPAPGHARSPTSARPTRIVIGRFPGRRPGRARPGPRRCTTGVEAPRLVVDVEAAEIIKNGANAFLALKLSFTNEIASLCEEAGADVDDVLAGIGADPRIGATYMQPELRVRWELPAEGADDPGAARATTAACRCT